MHKNFGNIYYFSSCRFVHGIEREKEVETRISLAWWKMILEFQNYFFDLF